MDASLLSKIGYTDYNKFKDNINCLILKEELLQRLLITLQYLFSPSCIQIFNWALSYPISLVWPCKFQPMQCFIHNTRLEGVVLKEGGRPSHSLLFASAWNLDIFNVWSLNWQLGTTRQIVNAENGKAERWKKLDFLTPWLQSLPSIYLLLWKKEINLYPVNCSLCHSEQNLIQTNTVFGNIFKNKMLCVTKPKFMELPAISTGPWSLGYYRLGKLEPLLFVVKYLVILSTAVPWKAKQMPTETFNIRSKVRKQLNADVHWLLLAMFSSLQESDELSLGLASQQAEIKGKPLWNGRWKALCFCWQSKMMENPQFTSLKK